MKMTVEGGANPGPVRDAGGGDPENALPFRFSIDPGGSGSRTQGGCPVGMRRSGPEPEKEIRT